MSFSDAPILDFDPVGKLGGHADDRSTPNKHVNEADISLALPDLSAIVSEK